MMLNRVVLPAPFGPMMENTRPGATARLTSSSACTPPNAIDRCSVASTVMRASPLVFRFRRSYHFAAPAFTNVGNKGTLASYDPGAALHLTFLSRTRGQY